MSGGGGGGGPRWPAPEMPGTADWFFPEAKNSAAPTQWAPSGGAPGGVAQAPPPVVNPPHHHYQYHNPPALSYGPPQGMPEVPPFPPTAPPPSHYPPPHYSHPYAAPYHLPARPCLEPAAPPTGHAMAPAMRPPGLPPPILPYPPPGPSPGPPSCPPPAPPYTAAAPGYSWAPAPQMAQAGALAQGPQRGLPPQQPWPRQEWEQSCPPPRQDHGSRHTPQPGLERDLMTCGKPFRDPRARDHEPAGRGDTRTAHSSRYDSDQRSLEAKYKEDRGYPSRWPEGARKSSHSPSSEYSSSRSEGCHYSSSSRSSREPHARYEKERDGVEARYKRDSRYSKCSEDRWPDRGSSSSSSRKRSRSPTDAPPRRRESKNYSPPSRTSRGSLDRSQGSHSRAGRVSRSPGRQSLHSRSPIRKRPPHPRSPETQRGSTPDRAASAPATKKPMCGERQTPPESDPLGAPMKEMQELGDDLEENGIEEEETKAPWVRSAPADLYYQRDEKNPLVTRATKKLMALCDVFGEKLVKRGERVREDKRQKAEKSKAASQQLSVCSNGCSKTKVGLEGDGGSLCQEDTVKAAAKDKTEGKQSVECGEPGVEDSSVPGTVPSTGGSEGAGAKPASEVAKRSCKHRHKHKKKKGAKDAEKSGEAQPSNSSSSGSSSECDDSSSSEEEEESEMDRISKELEKKRNHPNRLHPELWFNDPGEMNDGPLCRCSLKAQRSGIRHGYYVGEDDLTSCDPWSNNADRLHHYLITISPPTNFLIKTPTVILHDSHEFIFEGFSLLSHHPLEEVPTCRVIRFNIEYTILYIQEKIPDNFCIEELNLLYQYLFLELLELVDLNLKAMGDEQGCPRFHFMPRFVRKLADNGKEILSMNEVLSSLLKNSGPLVQPEDLAQLLNMSQYQWQNYADQLKGMVVTCPGMKPCSIRVDQLDRDQVSEDTINYPVIVHFGIRPPQLSYAGNPEYQKAWREYVKFRHLLANMPKPSFEDKRRLEGKENRLQEMRMTSKMKRDVTVAVSSQGFYRTGIMCDVVQHAMLLPVLVCHLRFHQSLQVLEEGTDYKFQTRFLLQLALTHPSYRENFGTNPDHARNSLTNCGIRQPEYGDRRIHYMNTRKRGINTLINIMSRFGRNLETESKITHNERLEFLGDAVVEFLTSIHLFHLFPNLEEGGLATYRAAIVQNQHLAVLAEKLGLDQFMLYAHGSDLCHDFELRHAMANCFEALMGAIFLDSGIEEADKVLSSTLFKGESVLHNIWVHYPSHPIQEQEPQGDRKWIKSFPILTNLSKFEGSIGVEFKHIRLLARAFTDRSIGFNNLTLGSNQRLEFLGDTVLQLVSSEYLYRYFPEHHEGHLSLLRSSLVNNRTQAVVCDDLGMTSYAMYSHLKTELKTKDRADLLEAFLGALYIDRGLKYCRTFCHVCFFPRLHQFIMNQDWNDPKSKLQQCCLTLRTMDGGEPDIPIYKVIECKGPTNTRVYTVAVYFRGRRLAKASGHSIQQAEMNAAREALMNSKELFPQLDHQRRVIEKSVKIQGIGKPDAQDREKDRGRERNGRGHWREEERRGDRDRFRDRDKVEGKDTERNRDGERRDAREKHQTFADGEKLTERMKMLERERSSVDGEGERERNYTDRERSGEWKRGRTDSEDDRRHRNETESRTSGPESRSRYSKHVAKDGPDSDKQRDRHKVHGRPRRSESPVGGRVPQQGWTAYKR